MREELFEEILSLVEEYINEVSVKRWKEAALNSIDSRNDNRSDHAKEVASLPNSIRSANNVVRAAKNSAENREEKRRKEYRRRQASVPFGYRDVPDDNTIRNTKRTDRAYELATTNNKNAKELYGDYVDEVLSLALSNECFEEIWSLVEGELIDFQKKRKEKTVMKNFEKLMKMHDNGELRAIRTLPNGEVIGDPHYVKILRNMKKENENIINGAGNKVHEDDEQPSYIDNDGATQFQLFRTDLTGKNLQQENKPQPKVKKPKNPNRVEGGKKARQTRIQNVRNEFANRSIFKALGYNPYEDGGTNG